MLRLYPVVEALNAGKHAMQKAKLKRLKANISQLILFHRRLTFFIYQKGVQMKQKFIFVLVSTSFFQIKVRQQTAFVLHWNVYWII